MIMSVGHDIAQLPHFCIYWVNEPDKRLFFKAILYYWCKCSISTYWNGKLGLFLKKKKDVTIQQQYICKLSTSNFKCHSCTFNRTRALIESSICKLWKLSPFFFHNISCMPTFLTCKRSECSFHVCEFMTYATYRTDRQVLREQSQQPLVSECQTQ